MILKKTAVFIFCTVMFFPFWSSSQIFPEKKYPQGYFRDPLDLPISLSGNFGELRPNHYHMGLDIKTMARVNFPVYAAADGYIARIKIEPFGFGRAIYINHPNGYTTLYAHLNEFYPALEQYVKTQQYKQQTWTIFLDLPPSMFVLKKGTFIAFSGTTGGSQAPHLHFEMRRTADDVNLNPMLFGLPLEDNTKPVVRKLAYYDRNLSTYEQSPKPVPLKAAAGGYTAATTVVKTASAKISFAIAAFDTHTGSTNQNGIYETLLYDNNTLASAFQIDNISYDDTRFINAHIDYKTKATGGGYLQHLSVLPGYVNSIYKKIKGDGVLDLSDQKIHEVRIEVRDAYGNRSIINLSVQYNGATPVRSSLAGKVFYPLMVDIFEDEDCEFFIGEKCLYDSVHIRYARSLSAAPGALSAVHAIGNYYIPLQDSMVVRIKPLENIPVEKMNRVIMQCSAGKDIGIRKVSWQRGWATAGFRSFGNFTLLLDDEAPQILPVGFINGADLSKSSSIAFTVKDNLDEFNNFRAELDGKWLRFTNDKGRTFIYRFDEMCAPGPHQLKVSVDDEAGNITTKFFQFTR